MRNLKKFLALVLALVMAMSLMVTANAANAKTDYPDMEGVTPEFVEAVDVLSGMGVFRGNNGQFLPQNKIMRCEAVAILYRLVTGDVDDKQAELYAPLAVYFNDVKATDWFAPYVGFAVDAGYIKGYNGNFNPYANVTGYEMLAMLLRAVGYGKNAEFTGAQWKINVGSTAQNLGILKDIESTHYKNTLSQASPREVVADLTFRVAVDVHQVRYEYGYYNPYIGVANAQGGNYYNLTLGEKVFGLTSLRSIIVGNQATGEKGTRLGRGVSTSTTPGNNMTDDYGNPIILEYTDADRTELAKVLKYVKDDGSIEGTYAAAKAALDAALAAGDNDTKYEYAMTSGSSTSTFAGLTYVYGSNNLMLDFKTGLDQFAHEATAWYNYNSWDGTSYHTYALIDHVKSDEAFFADDNTHVGKTAADKLGVTGATKGTVLWSDRYSQIASLDFDADTNLSPISTYRKVVNPSGTVYIALSAEVAEIAQKNTTAADPYLILGSNADNVTKFKNTHDTAHIFLENLTSDTKDEQKKVGALVTAYQVVGTSFTLAEADALDTANAQADDNRIEDVMYKLDPMTTKTVTVGSLQYTDDPGSIDTFADPVIKVFTTAGDELNLSGITLGSREAAAISTIVSKALPVVVKTDTADKGDIALKANTTYAAYVDIVGRFISLVPANDYKFLYGTYAGYDLNGYDAGTIEYNIVGVDWDAKIQPKNVLKSLTLNEDGDAISTIDDPTGKIEDINGTRYNLIDSTKKDQGQADTAGNEIMAGADTGYMYNATTGDLALSEHTKMVDNMIGAAAWTITAQDAKNGFVKVNNSTDGTSGIDYLLTKDTHFIVVSGTGTATLKVREATGLSQLLDGATSANITFDADATDGKQNEVIWRTEAEKYGTMFTDDNGVVTDMILSEDNLILWNTQTLYYDFDQLTDTGITLPGAPATVKQYDLWQGGQKVSVFVDTTLGDGGDIELTTGGTADSLFFTLAKAYEVNKTPVYMAVKAPAANGGTAGVGGVAYNGFSAQGTKYDYVTVTNLTTGLFKKGANTLVLGLDNVTVCDVQFKTTTNAKDTLGRSEITNVLELNNAVSVGKLNNTKEYSIDVAVVYDNSNAGAVTIYVLDT